MDCLQITALAVATRIGVYAWEQQILQQLFIDISIPADFKTTEDDLAKTIDYEKLCQVVSGYVEAHSFQLIETVANNVALLIKEKFAVNQLTISVSKPHAVKNASNIKVTVTR